MVADVQDFSIQKRRANRRGFIVGLALAELMLVILFVLLLLNRSYQLEQEEIEEVFGGDLVFVEAQELGRELSAAQSQTELSDTWRTLTRTVEQLGSGSGNELQGWIEDLESKLEDEQGSNPASELAVDDAHPPLVDDSPPSLQEEIEHLSDALADAESAREQAEQRNRDLEESLAEQQSQLADAANQRSALSEELARAKAGELVICTYEPSQPDSQSPLRGRSIPLGTVYLEADGITLIERNPEMRQNNFVDYVGDQYDASDAISLLYTWPMLQKFSFEELDTIGRQFIAIGDRDVETRSRCRFSMDYYIEDFLTPHSVLLTFERYFFQQSRVSDAEFEQILQASTEN